MWFLEEIKRQVLGKGFSFFALVFLVSLSPFFGLVITPIPILILGFLWLASTWLFVEFDDDYSFSEEIWLILDYRRSVWIAVLIYVLVGLAHPLEAPFVFFVSLGVLLIADWFDPCLEYEVSFVPEGMEEGYVITTSRFLTDAEAADFFNSLENGEFNMYEIYQEELEAIQYLIDRWWSSWHRDVEDEDCIYEDGKLSLTTLEEHHSKVLKCIRLVQSAMGLVYDLNTGCWYEDENLEN